MVQLVLLLDPAENADRVLDRRLADEHRLEAPRQGGVLLDMLAVFVERGRADAVQRTARQLRLDQVGGVHRPVRLARSHQRVHLVDEQDDVALCLLDLLEDGLQTLLELAAVFGTRDHGAEVEGEQLLALQRLGHVTVDDAQSEALDDRGLADAGLADQHRVVLGAARQHLHGAPDFLVAADHRVEFPRPRDLGDVAGVFFQRVEIGFGVGGGHLAALAQIGDRPVERLCAHPGGFQRPGGRRVGAGERDQQTILRDIVVTGALSRLLRGVEHPNHRGDELRRAGPAALDLRQLAKLQFDGGARGLVVTAGGADQAGGGPFVVVEQRLQQVLGRELLVKFADCDGLRGLDEAFRPFGEFFDVHFGSCP